jgi:hypothetical protein
MQWIEKLPFEVDVKGLVGALENGVKNVGPMLFQGSEFGYNNFGGWNLQSRTGDHRDGFNPNRGLDLCWKKDGTFNFHLAKFLNHSHPFEHKYKTNACVDPIGDVVDFLEEKGFYPRRMRLTCLKPHSKSIIHRDSSSDEYFARIHIPLITNPKCIHWTEFGEVHMPADGSVYMLWVNCMHQIRNDSDEDRYHIICDAYDTKGITKNFRYTHNIQRLVDEATAFRRKMDSIENGWYRNLIYSIGRSYYSRKFHLEQKLLEASYRLNNDPKHI